jgi:hypothetical protein
MKILFIGTLTTLLLQLAYAQWPYGYPPIPFHNPYQPFPLSYPPLPQSNPHSVPHFIYAVGLSQESKLCQHEGLNRVANDCNKYCNCIKAKNMPHFLIIEMHCPQGFVFDESLGTCNLLTNVPECQLQKINVPKSSGKKGGPTITATASPTDDMSSEEQKQNGDEEDNDVGPIQQPDDGWPGGDQHPEEGKLPKPKPTPSSTTTSRPPIKGPPTPSSTTTLSTTKTQPPIKGSTPPGGGTRPTGDGKFPRPKPTTSSTTTTTSTPRPQPGGGGSPDSSGGPIDESSLDKYLCPSSEFHRAPDDCSKFYRCIIDSETGRSTVFLFDCPPGSLFDESKQNCVFDYTNGDCKTPVISKPLSIVSVESSVSQSNVTKLLHADEELENGRTDDQMMKCTKEGEFMPDKVQCDKFYRCTNGINYEFTCPEGLVFDSKTNICNYPSQVQGPCRQPGDGAQPGQQPGDQEPGDQQPGDQQPGQQPGGQQPGQQPGGQQPGQQPGGQQPGQQPGGQWPGQQPGGQQPGQQPDGQQPGQQPGDQEPGDQQPDDEQPEQQPGGQQPGVEIKPPGKLPGQQPPGKLPGQRPPGKGSGQKKKDSKSRPPLKGLRPRPPSASRPQSNPSTHFTWRVHAHSNNDPHNQRMHWSIQTRQRPVLLNYQTVVPDEIPAYDTQYIILPQNQYQNQYLQPVYNWYK